MSFDHLTPTLLLSPFQAVDAAPPVLNPVQDLRGGELELVEQANELAVLEQMLATSGPASCPRLAAHMEQLDQAHLLERTLAASGLRAAVSEQNVQLMADFQQRLAVLQRLGYVDTERAVQLKGRVAAEVSTCDALIVTELVFENVLTDLPPEQAVALLSALVFQQKNTPEQLELVPESLRQVRLRVCLCLVCHV